MALSRDKILAAALALVDEQGLGKLTMRALGAELGVEAMALYRYVDNKSELLDGLIEAVLAEVALPAPSGDWRADAIEAGEVLLDAFAQHPRTLSLFASRPAVTPASLDVLERALALLAQDGADTAVALARFNSLFGFVLGFAVTQLPSPDFPSFEVAYEELPAVEHPHLSNLRAVLSTRDPIEEFRLGLHAMVRGWD